MRDGKTETKSRSIDPSLFERQKQAFRNPQWQAAAFILNFDQNPISFRISL